MVEGGVKLVDGVRPECIPHLGSVESDPYRPDVSCPVVGDVGEVEARDLFPG